jgi:hypothetical protein
MSKIEVNAIEPQCGTNLTVGASGDTITFPSGTTVVNNGTAAGFGATGAASWDTTVKTASFTGVAGVGYFVDTTSGAITVTLPASPDAGAVIAVKDYANTFDTNNVTLARNGSNIGGNAVNATLSTEGLAITLVYVDATKGWLVTDDGLQSQAAQAQFVTATGGTISTCGNFKTHIFTGPGTFCVSCAGNACGSNTIDYFVVAGGGGASGDRAGGAGAGGFRLSNSVGCLPAPSMSPLANPSGLPVSATGYPVTIGAGGSGGGGGPGSKGSDTVFSTITSAGGGTSVSTSPGPDMNGGSGGGAYGCGCYTGGTGNSPPVSPPQGNNGGPSPGGAPSYAAGGGGGAGAAGTAGTAPPNGQGGPGGAGSFISTSFIGPISPSYGQPGPAGRYFSGGGGGGYYDAGFGGDGGLGGGGAAPDSNPDNGVPGTVNTGGGGGGGNTYPATATGGTGGSGIVMIRYKFQ